jgi:hypothetical protein
MDQTGGVAASSWLVRQPPSSLEKNKTSLNVPFITNPLFSKASQPGSHVVP